MPNPEISFPARYTTVNAVAYAKPDGSAEVVAIDKPLPVTSGAVAFALADGSQQPVSATAPLPVSPGTITFRQADGSAQPVSAAVPLPVSPGNLAFRQPDGSSLQVSATAPLPVTASPLPASSAHIGNVFVDDVADGFTVQGSVNTATTVVSSSLAGFGGGAFHVTSGGTGNTVSYEQSNDGVNWTALPVIAANGSTTSPSTTSTIGGFFAFASSAAQVRARVSTLGTGTVTIVLTLKRRPLNVMGTSLAGGGASIGNVAVTGTVNTNLGYTDSVASLAASTTFTGTGRQSSGSQYSYFNAVAFADVAGTLFIDQSLDTGATYQAISSVAVGAGAAQQLSVRLTGTFGTATLYRVRYVNGAAAQGTFRLSSAFSAR